MIPSKKMPSVMGAARRFASTPQVQTERSVFDRSHSYKTTCDSGLLIPMFVALAYPGDTHDVRLTGLARLSPLVKPLMDNLYMDTFFFAVPLRLVWTNFVKMFGEQANPADSISFTVPQTTAMPAAGFALGSRADYMGLPTVGVPAVVASISVSALPFRAYQLIWNQWFRDQNLINSVTVQLDDGPDPDAESQANQVPFKRGKRHDYFTSCLPSPQKGSAASIVPSGVIPVVMAGVTGETAAIQTAAGVARNLEVVGAAPSPVVMDSVGGGIPLTVSLGGLTINDLRLSIATQQFLERDARGGTRYPEQVYAHWGVKSSDARMQRAEYLGGGSSPVVIGPLGQTTQAAVPTNKDGLANLAGVAGVVASGHGFSKSFEEHCLIIGIMNFRADLTYSQGIEREWSYLTRLDFPDPVFANIGEQAVLNKEIYATGAAADTLVFGYQERFAEARYKPSKLTNLMRPTAAGTLEIWHASEKFSVLPTLGQTFIEDQTETVLDNRLAVPVEPDWYVDLWFEYKAARALPVFGVPGLKRL